MECSDNVVEYNGMQQNLMEWNGIEWEINWIEWGQIEHGIEWEINRTMIRNYGNFMERDLKGFDGF